MQRETVCIQYFAYGSNLHPVRLTERAASCRVISVGEARGYRLRFHKRGKDGSGKCNCSFTGKAADCVIGALYELDHVDKVLLDQVEGPGYRVVDIEITSGTETLSAYTYVARPEHIDDDMIPYEWYHQVVLSGATHHHFPQDYITEIRSVQALEDPDTVRAARHYCLLSRMNERK